jgi:hypothetical protein
MYTHITEYRLDILQDQPSKDNRTSTYGKPVGFWFAPDLEWAKLMSAKGDLGIRAALLSDKSPARVHEYVKTRAPKYLEMYEWALGYRKEGSPPMVTEETKLSPYDVPYSGNHFVYQFSLDGKLENDMEKPGLDKVFNLTADYEAKFLAKVNDEMKESAHTFRNSTEEYKQVQLLGRYYITRMSNLWGGIVFDKSLFAGPVVNWSWKYYLEVPSGCLWHPSLVLGLKTPKEMPVPRSVLEPPTTGAGEAPPPTAVLAWAWSREGANGKAKLLEKWGDKLSIAGFDDKENLVFFLLNGQPPAGKGRGRTFRRKPKRSNKNGRRFTRKSKHDVRRDRHA